jgi:hypothetical protein
LTKLTSAGSLQLSDLTSKKASEWHVSNSNVSPSASRSAITHMPFVQQRDVEVHVIEKELIDLSDIHVAPQKGGEQQQQQCASSATVTALENIDNFLQVCGLQY